MLYWKLTQWTETFIYFDVICSLQFWGEFVNKIVGLVGLVRMLLWYLIRIRFVFIFSALFKNLMINILKKVIATNGINE